MPFVLKIFIINNIIGRKKGKKERWAETERFINMQSTFHSVVGWQVLKKVSARRKR